MHAELIYGPHIENKFWHDLQTMQEKTSEVYAFGRLYIEETLTDMDVLQKLSPGIPHDIRKENKTRTNTIGTDEISYIQEKLMLGSDSTRYVLILDPSRLTKHAANKLLKTLEEPGHNIQFLLYTENPSSVLATITSRCMLVSDNEYAERPTNTPFLGNDYEEYYANLIDEQETYEQNYTNAREFFAGPASKSLALTAHFGKELRHFHYLLDYAAYVALPTLRTQNPEAYQRCYAALAQIQNMHGVNVNKRMLLDNLIFSLFFSS